MDSVPKLAVLKFSAEWCRPCHACKPAFLALKQDFAENVEFFEVDVDRDAHGVADVYRIVSVPTFVVLFEGAEVARVVGPDVSKVREELESRCPSGPVPRPS